LVWFTKWDSRYQQLQFHNSLGETFSINDMPSSLMSASPLLLLFIY
jgi:hypothetical protein